VEDRGLPVENSVLFAADLRRAGVPSSLLISEKGAHGLGLGSPAKPAPPLAEQLLCWMKKRGLVK